MKSAEFLYEAANWADIDAIHAAFEDIRKNDPLHFQEMEGYPDFWHVTKHDDIFAVESDIDTFVTKDRIVVSTVEREEQTKQFTGGSVHLIRSLVAMDKPEHPPLRRLTQAWFMPKNLEKQRASVEASAEEAFQRLAAHNGGCDFAKDVAMEFPLRVVMTVLGVPREDYPMMLKLTQELFGPEDPDMKRESDKGIFETYMDYVNYFDKVTKDRQANPTDDVASLIANAEVDGKPLTDEQRLGYYVIVATAGHDTTSYSLSEALHQLGRNPELLERLKADPEGMAPKIAEEAIRYASPVRHFTRTATKDVELSGKQIKEGQSLILWYPSGSRDEDIFPDPHTFNPDRSTAIRHTAFGHGAHMCLGMYLARMEITTFLTLLAKRVATLELTAEPKYTQATFVSGIKSLPMKATLVD